MWGQMMVRDESICAETENFSDVEVLKRLIAYAVDEALRCDERMCADFLVAGLKVLDGETPSSGSPLLEPHQLFRDH